MLRRVEVIKDSEGNYVVRPVWANVDRPCNTSYSCGKNKNLAFRLKRAFEAGVVYENPVIRRNTNRESYVSYDFKILMRMANAELNRLGY